MSRVNGLMWSQLEVSETGTDGREGRTGLASAMDALFAES
jgi:hypothetical protein